MISEIYIRDWDKIDVNEAKTSLQNLGQAIHNDVFLDDYNNIVKFLNEVELIRRRQVKQIPVLFKGS